MGYNLAHPIKSFYFTCNNNKFICEVYPPHSLTKKSKITLLLSPDNIIKIKAPIHTAQNVILQVLGQHEQWILNHYNKNKQQDIHPLQYIHLEKHLYLSDLYPLFIEENAHKKQNIYIQDGTLFITVRHNTPQKIYSLIDSWYQFQALQNFSERINYFHSITPWIDWEKNAPILRIKKMKSRWGSYHSKQPAVITLNQHLIKAEQNCIDYVILHELCHAAEPNHSKNFYNLLASVMPDWHHWQSTIKQKSTLLLYKHAPASENH